MEEKMCRFTLPLVFSKKMKGGGIKSGIFIG